MGAECMSNIVGIDKEIDKLGRVHIPKEMRNLFKLEGVVELVITEDGILLRNKEYKLVRRKKSKKRG